MRNFLLVISIASACTQASSAVDHSNGVGAGSHDERFVDAGDAPDGRPEVLSFRFDSEPQKR